MSGRRRVAMLPYFLRFVRGFDAGRNGGGAAWHARTAWSSRASTAGAASHDFRAYFVL
ncbi:hypothetical protein BURPS1655_I0408 [Burkholderia pseudomallei 1655]|uniref:Uncharacterized protein n=1 Tax=Burkholderia mallei (strain NCTC 10229) TaxID=412022 RepID=A2RY37_BURM9|nr:hypothetical protein BMA10229_0791 [Burkholderia mallei NCTC 10229]EDU10826.1 hypothetical protein BURPS1655_I0408 [Burkholderia pseudomallei 1655]